MEWSFLSKMLPLFGKIADLALVVCGKNKLTKKYAKDFFICITNKKSCLRVKTAFL